MKIKELSQDKKDKLITLWVKWCYEANQRKITKGTREWFDKIWGRFEEEEFHDKRAASYLEIE